MDKTKALMVAALASVALLAGCADDNSGNQNTVIHYADGSTCDTAQNDNCPMPSDGNLYAGGSYYYAGGFYYPYPVYFYGGNYYHVGTHTIATRYTASSVPGNARVYGESRSAATARSQAFSARVSAFNAARSAAVSARAAGVSARAGGFGGHGVGGGEGG